MEDARRIGLANRPNWVKDQETMLFARALTRGARRHCPDVFSGAVYDLDELQDDIPERPAGKLPSIPPGASKLDTLAASLVPPAAEEVFREEEDAPAELHRAGADEPVGDPAPIQGGLFPGGASDPLPATAGEGRADAQAGAGGDTALALIRGEVVALRDQLRLSDAKWADGLEKYCGVSALAHAVEMGDLVRLRDGLQDAVRRRGSRRAG